MKELPPHLKTIVPAAAAHPGLDFPFQFIFCAVRHAVADVYERARGKRADLRKQGVLAAEGAGNVPAAPGVRDYDKLMGNPSPVFQKWMQHPAPDAYYDAPAPTAGAVTRR